jgi:hypothetical protein
MKMKSALIIASAVVFSLFSTISNAGSLELVDFKIVQQNGLPMAYSVALPPEGLFLELEVNESVDVVLGSIWSESADCWNEIGSLYAILKFHHGAVKIPGKVISYTNSYLPAHLQGRVLFLLGMVGQIEGEIIAKELSEILPFSPPAGISNTISKISLDQQINLFELARLIRYLSNVGSHGYLIAWNDDISDNSPEYPLLIEPSPVDVILDGSHFQIDIADILNDSPLGVALSAPLEIRATITRLDDLSREDNTDDAN